MLGLYKEKEIHPVIDREFEFEEAKNALKYLYEGGHFGKVVVNVPCNGEGDGMSGVALESLRCRRMKQE